MEKKLLLESIDFFNRLSVTEEDVTTDQERNNGQLVLKATYKIDGKSFTTQKLHYKNINSQQAVKHTDRLNKFYGEPVYWLDIDIQNWPQSSGTKLQDTAIADMAGDNVEFVQLLNDIANDDKDGYGQEITWEGRSAQYSINLENNNHWHDIIRLIQAVIKSGGQEVDKSYFKRLVFEWDSGARTSLHPAFGSRALIQALYKNIRSIQMQIKTQTLANLLKSKKQIILQGPPGTGKTHTAKEIAQSLTQKKIITQTDITRHISIGQSVKSCSDYTSYVIDSFSGSGVKVKTTTGSVYEPKYAEIISAFERKTWINGQVKNGTDSYSAAIAKHIDENLENDQIKLIQFHPAYSYEDFVRGITVQNKAGQIEYLTKNKVLGQFAHKAHQNFTNSQKEISTLAHENWLKSEWFSFVEMIQDEVEKKGKYIINDNVHIFDVDDNAFRYNGDAWVNERGHRMKFSDILQMFGENIENRKAIKDMTSVSGSAKQHATYYLSILLKFREFLKTRPTYQPTAATKEEEKPYVLIIDEINRANLPAVLGELIYALEYRGESVESMYELEEGGNRLVLPKNLYIIGTMNTADRSVGHIDYAIRRRFSFVEVLPSSEVLDKIKDEEVRKKAKTLYKKVEQLFVDGNIAPDFKADDVQLGHSYFLADTEEELNLKLEYDIKPLLNEYLKDGILQTSISTESGTLATENYIKGLSW